MKFGEWYIVSGEFPTMGNTKTVGMFVKKSIYDNMALFQFPQMAGKLHNGVPTPGLKPNMDCWWVFDNQMYSKLKQGERL